jgi:hypothetical protein
MLAAELVRAIQSFFETAEKARHGSKLSPAGRLNPELLT